MGATVTEIVRDKGKAVAKGDTILILDSRRYEAAHKLAKASLENAQLDFNVAKKQFEKGLGVSEIQFKKIENAMRIAEAQEQNARIDLDNCFITAPFKGVVAERHIDLGELAAPGMPVIRLVDNSSLKVSAGVPETQSLPVKKGKHAVVRITQSGVEYPGVIEWVGATLEPRGRTLPVEVSLKSTPFLRPGMVCEVILEKDINNSAVVIPLSVIQKAPTHSFVFVNVDNKAVYKQVDPGDKDGEMVEILSGLSTGDELIVEGYRDLVDGQELNVVGRIGG